MKSLLVRLATAFAVIRVFVMAFAAIALVCLAVTPVLAGKNPNRNLMGTSAEQHLREYIKVRCSGNDREVTIEELWRHPNGDISGKFTNRSQHTWKLKEPTLNGKGKKRHITAYSNRTTLHFHGDPNPKNQTSGAQLFLSNGTWVFANDLARVVDRKDAEGTGPELNSVDPDILRHRRTIIDNLFR